MKEVIRIKHFSSYKNDFINLAQAPLEMEVHIKLQLTSLMQEKILCYSGVLEEHDLMKLLQNVIYKHKDLGLDI